VSALKPADCAALRLLTDRLWDLSSHTDLGALLVALAEAAERELEELEQFSSDRWLQELRQDRSRIRRDIEELAGELEQTARSEPAADGSSDWYTPEEAASAARALRALMAASCLDGPDRLRAEAAEPPAGEQIDVGAALGLIAGCVAEESEAVRSRVLGRVRAAFRAWQG
jgi:hypothetical protein